MAIAALKYPEQVTFASVLKEWRSARGLTQEELAEQAGLSARLISDLERGIIHRPRRETIRMLADGLSLSGADRDQFVLFARNGRTAQPGGTGSPPPVSLPVQPTPLIGRDSDIEAALAVLRGFKG